MPWSEMDSIRNNPVFHAMNPNPVCSDVISSIIGNDIMLVVLNLVPGQPAYA